MPNNILLTKEHVEVLVKQNINNCCEILHKVANPTFDVQAMPELSDFLVTLLTVSTDILDYLQMKEKD